MTAVAAVCISYLLLFQCIEHPYWLLVASMFVRHLRVSRKLSQSNYHHLTYNQGRKLDIRANSLQRELDLKQNDLGVEVILM